MRILLDAAAILLFVTVYVALLPQLQLGASLRLDDGSIRWLPRTSDRRRRRIGGATQVGAAISVFSALWLMIHIATRHVMHMGLLASPYGRLVIKDENDIVEVLTVMSLSVSGMALICETVFAPLLLLLALTRGYDVRFVPTMLPWALVAVYTWRVLLSPVLN